MTRLDDDLAAWAAATRLPDAGADAICQRIIATPAPAIVTPGLAPSWWRQFNADVARRMVASTRPAA